MKKKKINYLPYWFLLPGFILMVVFIFYPSFQNLYKALYNSDGIFIGLSNFIKLIQDEEFLLALKNTIIYCIVVVSGTSILGFSFAYFINIKVKGWKLYRFVLFLPIIMSTAVVSLLWYRVYDPTVGIINVILELLNLGFLTRSWLGQPNIVLYAVAVVEIWKLTGLPMVFFLAGLKSIPTGIYEAAKIDGANNIKCLLYITIPMMKNIIATVIIFMVVISFKVFDIVFLMTGGGPLDYSKVLSIMIYEKFLIYRQTEIASAISVFVLVISIIFGLIYLYFLKRREA